MIGRLHGTLLEKSPPDILLDVNGIGYEISMPMNCIYHLPEIGHSTIIYTHFIVREDAHLLYGFTHPSERSLFREVIKANGVGPKLGLAILSAMTADQFVACVEHEDVSRLVKIPGVGKKTAERLVIEMRDRLKNWHVSSKDFSSNTHDKTRNETSITHICLPVQEEAIGALMTLGYKAAQAQKMVNQVMKEGMRCEDIIRDALRTMV